MSIEKLDSVKIKQEKIPFTIHLNYVLQNVKHPLALAIWVYLTSLPEAWVVHRNQLMEHFGIGRDKLKDALSFLNENHLLEYSQDKLENGKFGTHHILVKSGQEFEVIHRTVAGGLKNRSTVLPVGGETAPIKEIRNINKETDKKKSFCENEQKKSKSDWREQNARKPEWAESKNQMANEQRHIEEHEAIKRAPMPETLRATIKNMKYSY